jgi:hypothetical protein
VDPRLVVNGRPADRVLLRTRRRPRLPTRGEHRSDGARATDSAQSAEGRIAPLRSVLLPPLPPGGPSPSPHRHIHLSHRLSLRGPARGRGVKQILMAKYCPGLPIATLMGGYGSKSPGFHDPSKAAASGP